MISNPQVTSYLPKVPPLPPPSLNTCSDYALFPDGSMGRNYTIPDHNGGVSHEILKERIKQEIYADMEREKAWKDEIRKEILMEIDFSAQKVIYDMVREKALKEEIVREILMERDIFAPKTMLHNLSNVKNYREGSVSRLLDFIDNGAREIMPFQRHPEAMAANAVLAPQSAKERLLLLPQSKKTVLPRIGFGTIKQEFRCALCQLSLSSAKQLDDHTRGKKHQAKASQSKTKSKANPNRKLLKEKIRQEIYADMARETALKEELRREVLMEKDFSVGKMSITKALGLVNDKVKQKIDPQSAKEMAKPSLKMLPTISSAKTRKQDFRCTQCELSLTSAKFLEGHLKGKKHQAKVSNSETKHKATSNNESLKEGFTQEVHTDVAREKASACKLEASALKVELAPQSAEERSLHLPKPNSKLLFRCALCELSLTSAQVLQVHIGGKKHQAKVLESKIKHKATSNSEPSKEGTRQVIHADMAREKASAQDYRRVPFCYKV